MNARRRTASNELEGRILESALELLGDGGIEALTVRGIAQRAGVAPMGIYNHFDGKTGIYEALWVDGFDRLSAAMADESGEEEALPSLVSCGLRYRKFALEHPAHYRLMFLDRNDSFTPSAEAAAASGRSLQTLINRVERAQREGLFPPDRPIDIAQAIWATVHGFVSLELKGVNFSVEPEATFISLMHAVTDGYRARVAAR